MAAVSIAIFFFICILFVIAAIITEIPKFLIGVYASIFLICVCIYKLPNKKDPSKLYQEKVEAVEKANKELEKFLIDYPEFREK